MLQRISTVTYQTNDLFASRSAIIRYFNYRLVSELGVGEAIADAWKTPPAANRKCAVLQPESGEPFYIRLIEQAADAAYEPLKTYGWNAAELLLHDVHATADSLQNSPFAIIGGPRDLMNNGVAIALQVAGPARELFYLTQLSGKAMQTTYGAATCDVDRAFIVVLGAQNMEKTRDFYRPIVKGVTRPRQFAIRVLSAAHKADPDTVYKICAACLPTQNRIEIDAYPDTASLRHTAPGMIPSGLGIVSFSVASLDDIEFNLDIRRGPDTAPYFGCRMALVVGPSGEWLELLESPDNR